MSHGISNGKVKQHNLQDVSKVVDKYFTDTGEFIQQQTDLSQVKEAEKRFTEGLSKLKRLNLSAGDRKHLRLAKEAFSLAIKSMKAIGKGKPTAGEQFMALACVKAVKYTSFIMAEGGRHGSR